MAETIQDVCGVAKWHWYNVMKDLEKQGGLFGVVIDPLSVNPHGCSGQYCSNRFYITWVHNLFLLVTMQQFSQPIVNAFARVVEYQPFCQYVRNDMVTVEWDKKNPDSRFEQLQNEEEITELIMLNG